MYAQAHQGYHDFRENFGFLSRSARFQREMDGLWASICGRLGTDGNRSFLICSASLGEGCTTITMGLGSFVAKQTGKNVLLIDAQWDGNLLGQLLEDGELVPLIEEPQDRYTVTFDEYATSVPNLNYLKFRNPDSLETFVLNSEEIALFMQQIKLRYDFIFLDSPPVLASNVSPFLARQSDSVIFVIAASTLPYPMLREAISRMEQSRDRILGVVLNKREYPVPDYMYRVIR